MHSANHMLTLDDGITEVHSANHMLTLDNVITEVRPQNTPKNVLNLVVVEIYFFCFFNILLVNILFSKVRGGVGGFRRVRKA